MLRMALQAGIVDGIHCAMAFKKFRQGHGIFVVALDAKRERAKSAKDEPGIEGTKHCAQDDVSIPDPVNPFFAANDHAGEQVGVSAKIFRGAVKYQVKAEIERALVDGGGEGTVYKRGDPA